MALESIPPEEVGNRPGRQRGLGYVEPSQAVWDLLEETVQPYLHEIVRRAGLGMSDAALKLGLGVTAGVTVPARVRDELCPEWDLA